VCKSLHRIASVRLIYLNEEILFFLVVCVSMLGYEFGIVGSSVTGYLRIHRTQRLKDCVGAIWYLRSVSNGNVTWVVYFPMYYLSMQETIHPVWMYTQPGWIGSKMKWKLQTDPCGHIVNSCITNNLKEKKIQNQSPLIRSVEQEL
jgi:hypothetical protein